MAQQTTDKKSTQNNLFFDLFPRTFWTTLVHCTCSVLEVYNTCSISEMDHKYFFFRTRITLCYNSSVLEVHHTWSILYYPSHICYSKNHEFLSNCLVSRWYIVGIGYRSFDAWYSITFVLANILFNCKKIAITIPSYLYNSIDMLLSHS